MYAHRKYARFGALIPLFCIDIALKCLRVRSNIFCDVKCLKKLNNFTPGFFFLVHMHFFIFASQYTTTFFSWVTVHVLTFRPWLSRAYKLFCLIVIFLLIWEKSFDVCLKGTMICCWKMQIPALKLMVCHH